MSIKVYLLDDMQHTPFVKIDSVEYFKTHGIEITNKENEADLYVTRFFPVNSKKDLLFWRLKHKKIPILVWTHEPRYNTTQQSFFPSKIYIPSIYIMNCYTNDILVNPWCIYGSWSITHKLNFANTDHFNNHQKNICTLGSYRYEPLIINGQNIDLTEYRQAIAIEGYKQGIVDICGPNWPKEYNVILNNRNSTNWHQSKLQFIKDYKFNIALENTLIKNYITEKIWDPISQSVLPIYYGNTSIYNIFPKDSFIDTNNYANINDLLNHIMNLSQNEYLDRLNRCIEVYNKAYDTIDFKKEYKRVLDNIITKITIIISQNS